ncbi:PQQ-binding-like beta-propeller repeat protein [Actinoplanes sp. CA-142083]|uniref:outer membrane protein assembly factor BamB family protein n=1 Tax=Actinoplanes sp. CA-142083 TaxID=3239903 RepID=UPI003D8EDDAF
MRLRHGVAAAALLSTFVMNAGGIAAAEPRQAMPGWAQDGFGPGNGGFNPGERWLAGARLGQLAQQWSIPAIGQQVCARQAAPVTDGTTIYLPGRESLTAHDATTGKQIWSYPYSDPMDTRTPLLALHDGTLLVGTSGCQSVSDPNGELLALDPATGKPRWTAKTEAPDEVLAADDGVVVVGGADAGWMSSTAFSVATGKQVWERERGLATAGASARGTLLLTEHDTAFRPTGAVAVDIKTGKSLWHTDQPWSVRAADETGRFFLADDVSGALLKVNADSGQVVWTKSDLSGPLAVDRDQIYVVSGTALVSLAADTGTERWRRNNAGADLRPVVAGNVVYTVTSRGRLEALNTRNGHQLGFRPHYKPADHPVIDDGRLYLTDGKQLRAYAAPRSSCCTGPR